MENKIDRIIWDAVTGAKRPTQEDMELFFKWYKKEFGMSAELTESYTKEKVE